MDTPCATGQPRARGWVGTRRSLGSLALAGISSALTAQAPVLAQTPVASPAAGAFPRTIIDARGEEVTIPDRPDHVYTFRNYIEYDTALALGVVPAGWGSPGWGLTPYQIDSGGVENSIGVVAGLDIEEMLAREIDLILATESAFEIRSEELEALEQLGVPIVALPNADVHGQLAIAGQALGREEVARDVAAEFDARLQDFTPDIMPTSLSVIMFYDISQFYLYTDAAAASQSLVQLGLPPLSTPVEPAAGERADMVSLSVERAAEIDAEWVIGLIDDDPALAEEFMALPVFQAIPAVKAGRFRTLDASAANALSAPDVLTLPITIAALTKAFAADSP